MVSLSDHTLPSLYTWLTDQFSDPQPSTGLGFKDSPLFKEHLSEKAATVKSTLDSLFRRIAANKGDVKPEVSELESKLKTVLAKQKEYKVQVDSLTQKKDELSASLDAAMLRVVKAEKKLDRARSAQVQKLEQQAIGQATGRPAPETEENGKDLNKTNGHDEGLQLKYQEAVAAEAKLKEQLDVAMAEIKTLKEENSSLKMRRESVTDEDFVRTDVFKTFKSQNEDLIKRINDLEATNKQLRQEAEKLQAERTSFRSQLEREAQTVASDLEDQISSRDQDLTRIRSARDELLAELGIRKAAQDQDRTALEHAKELIGTTEDRIKALEMELERLRPSADITMTDPRPELESLTADELRERYVKLERDFQSINQELPAMEKAYRRSMAISQKKVMDHIAAEEKMAILVQEKSKADQKYFAARKDADIRNNEMKTLRQQNGKSSDIITSLKDHDAQARTLISNLEKQLTDLKQSNIAILEENRTLKSSAADALRRADQVKSQISELQNLVRSKDATTTAAKEQANSQEVETEKLKKKLEFATKDRDSWKKKCLSNSSEDEEMLRVSLYLLDVFCMAGCLTDMQNYASCGVCRANLNNAVIKTCGHVFCEDCLEARIANRLRKCPSCGKGYDKHDIMQVFMT